MHGEKGISHAFKVTGPPSGVGEKRNRGPLGGSEEPWTSLGSHSELCAKTCTPLRAVFGNFDYY